MGASDGGQGSGTGERWSSDLANMPTFSPTHPGGPMKKAEDVVAASGSYWVRPEKQPDGATGYAVLRGDRLVAAPPYYSKDPKRIKELQVEASKIASGLAWWEVTMQFVDDQLVRLVLDSIMAEDEADGSDASPTRSWSKERWSEDLTPADYQAEGGEGGDSWRSTEQHADLVGRTAHEP